MNIEKVTVYSDDLRQAINRLLPQLNKTSTGIDEENLKKIIHSVDNILFAVSIEGEYVGFALLTILRKLVRTEGFINDVVVDESKRGQGIGGKLMNTIIDTAWENNASIVELTSSPERQGAIRLYGKIGFKKRDTNVFRLTREQ